MRYLGLSAQTWEGLSWDLQETYLSGLAEDPEVPFSIDRATAPDKAEPGGAGPAVRENVDAGAEVFDITGMIAGLESNPDARRRS